MFEQRVKLIVAVFQNDSKYKVELQGQGMAFPTNPCCCLDQTNEEERSQNWHWEKKDKQTQIKDGKIFNTWKIETKRETERKIFRK